MEEIDWKNGGYPRYSVGSTDSLDYHIVASSHLKNWMENSMNQIDKAIGIADLPPKKDKIHVAYIGVDPFRFKRDVEGGKSVRQMYEVPEDQV